MNGVPAVNIPVGSDASVTQNGVAVRTLTAFAVSGQAVLTGSPAGALTFQASDDILVTNAQLPTNWSTIAGTSVAVAGAGTFLMPKIDCCYSAVRIVYTPTSGTGTVTANVKVLSL